MDVQYFRCIYINTKPTGSAILGEKFFPALAVVLRGTAINFS